MDQQSIELTQGHIDQFTLPWRADSRKKFPAVKKGTHVRVVDNDTAKEYRGYYGPGRTNEWISGLKGFFSDHPGLRTGDVVTVSFDPDGTLRLSASGRETLGGVEEAAPQEETAAPLERLVEDWLEKNPSKLEEGLKLCAQGRQFPAGGGRIDLLCADKDGKYVVVEIKRWKADDRTVGQILNYMAWVRSNLAKGAEVRGLVVSHDVDERLENAVSEVPSIKVKYYRMNLEFVSRDSALG